MHSALLSHLGAYYVQYYAHNWLIQNMTYEKALVKYKEYADSLNIPFRLVNNLLFI